VELRAQIAEALRLSGIAVEDQLVCGAGMADLVTARRDAVIEVKLDLSRKQLYAAISQVLLYRAAINPRARDRRRQRDRGDRWAHRLGGRAVGGSGVLAGWRASR
jgi:hypothetical protein